MPMESDQLILNFLDSMDAYLILMNSLSSTLRQGWLELASARHSMGAAGVSSTLFDLKSHHASTTLEVDNVDTDIELPHFTLCKWASFDDSEKNSGEANFKDDEFLPNKPESLHNGTCHKSISLNEIIKLFWQAQKARSRSLSMFGMLVSPKLRATQLSFETALEMLVEISNVRASLLRAHNQVQKDLKAAK
ncbi:hypothetical protein C2S53_003917 [Perilla frutescens var. hirtella]|uniref:Vacuolar ATPase assembly protein VMA22 n=1 Tax=Perilla frutescens var. hirtella TaxID=608512 RepID=A0AAD4JJH7_PERFH|nr:hypothetical protein C2S53_003917 [Perilla frutescens var. hirtella]